jgi:hypothetical protein
LLGRVRGQMEHMAVTVGGSILKRFECRRAGRVEVSTLSVIRR